MALVKLSNEILSIRGRFGGVYFKTGPDGQHVQAWPRLRKYQRSAAQIGQFGEGSPFGMSGIAGFSGIGMLWALALMAFFGGLWYAWAAVQYFTTDQGERKKITGWNWAVHYALAFPEEERPPFFKPPHTTTELPSYMILYEGMQTYHESPVGQPADYCTDFYWHYGDYNGKRVFVNDNDLWFLWWDFGRWVLSTGEGAETIGLTFYSPGADIRGIYTNPITGKTASVFWGNSFERENPP